MKRKLRLALDTARRENELKPSNSLLKKKASLRIPTKSTKHDLTF